MFFDLYLTNKSVSFNLIEYLSKRNLIKRFLLSLSINKFSIESLQHNLISIYSQRADNIPNSIFLVLSTEYPVTSLYLNSKLHLGQRHLVLNFSASSLLENKRPGCLSFRSLRLLLSRKYYQYYHKQGTVFYCSFYLSPLINIIIRFYFILNIIRQLGEKI